jgi:glycosyltransferase involved in cell wall biosynthesis
LRAVAEEPLKLAVLCDLLEERWFSMDLLADMLIAEAREVPAVAVTRVRPALPPVLARVAERDGQRARNPWGYRAGIGFGRFVQYPVAALRERPRYDYFHVVDHSYAHLLFELPARRAGVYCHDLDAFRPILEPRDPNPLRRALARTLLAGLRRAEVVFHSSLTVREQILEHRLVPAEKLVHAPYGVAPEFQPDPRAEDASLAGRPPFVMHVGSLIPRKNPEVLVALIAELCRAVPELEVFQMGGTWTPEQRARLEAAGVLGRVHQFAHMARPELSAYLRATRAVLLPSLAEGFGLPVVEALACGAPIVVNDIPVLVEVGGAGAVVRPARDLAAFRDAVIDVIRGGGPTRDERLRAAAPYTWAAHARAILGAYAALPKRR